MWIISIIMFHCVTWVWYWWEILSLMIYQLFRQKCYKLDITKHCCKAFWKKSQQNVYYSAMLLYLNNTMKNICKSYKIKYHYNLNQKYHGHDQYKFYANHPCQPNTSRLKPALINFVSINVKNLQYGLQN